MTKSEVLAKLAAKLDANRDDVKAQIERIANLPGGTICENGVDLMQQLSSTWKEGQALVEMSRELVGLIYPEDAPAAPQPPELYAQQAAPPPPEGMLS